MINVLKTKKYISDRYALARQKAWSGDFSDVVVSNVGFLLDLYHCHCLFFFSHLFSCKSTRIEEEIISKIGKTRLATSLLVKVGTGADPI